MRIFYFINKALALLLFSGSLLYGVNASLASTSGNADESDGGSFTVNFDGASFSSMGYTVSGSGTASNSAANYPDFDIQSGTIFPNGQSSVTVDLEIRNDTRYEDDETVIITIESGPGIDIAGGNTFTFTIDNDDNRPEMQFTATNSNEDEGEGLNIEVSISGDYQVGLTATIDWAIANGTTSAGDHDVSTSGTLTFTEGMSTRNIFYRSEDDGMDENDETFIINISNNNANCTLGGSTAHTHTVKDDDDPPSVGFSETATTKGETDGEITITLDLDAASGKTTQASIAVGAASTADLTEDYSNISATVLSYSAGDQSESFTLDIENDDLDEEDTETLILYISNTSDLSINAASDTLIISISDNDLEPAVSITAAVAGNEEVVNPTVTVSLDAVSGRDVTVTYSDLGTGTATAGADYTTFNSQSLTISAGDENNTFNLTVADDNINELDQTIIFAISNPTNASLGNAQQIYTITNDDAEPFCGFALGSSNVDEGDAGNTNHSINIVLKDAAGQTITSEKDITFNYSINAADGGTASGSGTDYTLAAGVLTIDATESSIDLDVAIVGDVLYEPDETIIIAIDPDGGGITNAQDGTMGHTVTIKEDDNMPRIQFSADNANGDEGSTTTITIEMDAKSSRDATVRYSTSDVTATGAGGEDYTIITNALATIDAGQTTTEIDLVSSVDALDENDETLSITLSNPNLVTLDANDVLTFTINDDDPEPTVSFAAGTPSDSEAETSPSFTINLSAPSGRDLIVGYAVTNDGTAEGGGTDYTLADNAALTIDAGEDSETIDFTVNNDNFDEIDETIVIDLTAVTNVTAGPTLQQMIYTIEDNDDPPTIYFRSASSSAAENEGTKSVELILSGQSGKDVTVVLTDGGAGTATATDDYAVATGVPNTITIDAMETAESFDVTLVDDEEDEDDETIVLGLTGENNATLGINQTHTLTIEDSDPIPSVSFSNEDGSGDVQTVIEAADGVAGSYTIEVVLNYKSYQTTTVDYSVNASSTAVKGSDQAAAEADDDYTLAGSGTLTFDPGDTLQTIDFAIVDDNLDEYDEVVIIDLTANSNCTVGAIGQLVITISDDDEAPVVRFSASADAAGTEGDAMQTVEVTMTPKSGKDVVIPYTIDAALSTTTNSGAASDHDLSDGTVTILAGSTTGDIEFDIEDDTWYENTEDLVIALGTPQNGDDDDPTGQLHGTASFIVHTFTITSDDAAPSVQFESSTASVNETNSTQWLTVTLTLSAISEVDAKVWIDDGNSGDATPGGGDYNLTSTQLTIPAGKDTEDFTGFIWIRGDATDEANQTMTLSLTTPDDHVSLGTPRTQVLTIVDDDDPPVISIDTTNSGKDLATVFNENAASVDLIFTLTPASEKDISIDYEVDVTAGTAATLGQDYSGLAATGTITMGAGKTDTTFTITILDDLVDEENQTITVDLSSGTEEFVSMSSDINTYTMKILDNDDVPSVWFGTSESSDDEGNTGTNTIQSFTVTMSDTSEKTVTIPYTISTVEKRPATLGTDYTSAVSSVSIAPDNGRSTVDISMTILGDDKDEYDQTITINLGPTDGDISNGKLHASNETSYVYTISDDDDPPSASIAGSGAAAEEASQTITITLDAESEKSATFTLTNTDVTATETTDYTISAKSDIVIPIGDTENSTVTVDGEDDSIYETDETFSLVLAADSNATLGTSSLTVTLQDDDPKSKCSFETTGITFAESAGAVKVPIELDKPSGFDTEITYVYADDSATDGDDYTIVYGTITIPAGSIRDSITVNIVDDNLAEETESILFTITDVGGNTDFGAYTETTLNITDEDNPPADFTVGGITTVANDDATKSIKQYWNSYNDSLWLKVPIDIIESNADLDNGSVQLLAKVSGGDYSNLGDPVTISWADMKGDSLRISIDEETFEAHSAYGDGNDVLITARITDQYSNYTDGTPSADTITVDVTSTIIQTVGDVVASGGTEVATYWNGTNNAMNVTVPLANDPTLIGGNIQLQAKVTPGNVFTNVGDPVPIVGAYVNNSTQIPVDSSQYSSLADFGDNLSIYHTALVTDVAGNERVFNTSNKTVLIDVTPPTFASATSTEPNGYYSVGDTVTFSATFDDSVTRSDNGTIWTAYLNSGHSITGQIEAGNMLTMNFTDTVNTGDASPDFGITSIVITEGTLRDIAGNDMSTFTIPDGNNISDSKNIYIDGVAPANFTLTSVTTVVDSVYPAYFNSVNSGLIIPVELDNDTTLIGGTIQIVAMVDTTGNFPPDFDTTNIGSPYTILESDLPPTDSVAMSLSDDDLESASSLADLRTIYFAATVTDVAGNSTESTQDYLTALTYDHTAPSEVGIDSVKARGDVVVPGYLNNTNNSLIVWADLDSEDESMKLGGRVRIQARMDGELTWTTLNPGGLAVSSDDVDPIGWTDVIIEYPDYFNIPGVDETNKKMFFRSILTDRAGNETIQAISSHTMVVDTVSLTGADVSYSRPYANSDETVIITVTFPEKATGYVADGGDFSSGSPRIAIDYQGQTNGDVDYAELTLGSVDSTVWTYTAEIPDDSDIDGVVTINLYATDLAGNPLDTTNISNQTGLTIDNVDPEITMGYSNNTSLDDPPSIGKGGDVISVTASWNENIDLTVQPQLTATYTNDSTDVQNYDVIDGNNWTYKFTLPTGSDVDGLIAFTSSGSDSANNSEFTYINSNTFLIDNTAPIITGVTPADSSFVNSSLIGYKITDVNGKLDSASISYRAISGPGEDFSVDLVGVELDTVTHPVDSLTNQATIQSNLADSTLYRMIFTTVDSAGNIGSDTVNQVTYDTSAPYASLSFNRQYASEGTVVRATATFSENMLETPEILLYFGPDTNSSIQGQMTATEETEVWTYDFSAPADTANDGMVRVWFNTAVTMDRAQNQLRSPPQLAGADSVIYADTLYIENIVSQATFSYTNNSDTTLSNIGIGGQNILITVEMNELISTTTPVPTLSYWYNYENTSENSVTGVTADSSKGDTTWYFNIELADGTTNDGAFHASFIAKDRPGNDVEQFVKADLFQVDNMHPANFQTGSINLYGKNPVSGWLNGITDSIEVKLPLVSPQVDSTIYKGGRVDFQVFNITRGTQWKTLFKAGSTLGDSIITMGDSVKFYRTMASIIEQLPDGTDLVLGDSIKFRGKVTDRNGNFTYGTESIIKFRYDPTAPIVGSLTGGNFVTLDTLFSSDTVSIKWSEFTDFGDPEYYSGTERYEVAVEKMITSPDSINNFHNWDTIPFPTEPHELILFLEHEESYVAHIRAFDAAGNISDTLHSDTLLRYSSNPIIGDLEYQTLYEDDSTWINQVSVNISDLDLNTLQSDSFRYQIETTRIQGDSSTSNVATIDSIGRMSWVPTQDDTGRYEMKVIAVDNYSLTDTMTFPLEVVAVNDTPVVNILSPDNALEWIEDDTATVKINLTSYLDDVDNNDSTEMSWQAVILDTSQLDDEYPLGHVIVGPGTPWNIHAKLMREYLGFNLHQNGNKSPVISKRTASMVTTSRQSNPLLSVRIDTASSGENWAYFESDSNYFGSDHRIIFIVNDPDGADARDTIMATVLPKNDPPIIAELPQLVEVTENDSIKLEFGSFTHDIDDTELTFQITSITNGDKMTISPGTFVSENVGDSVLFIPDQLWSNEATIQVIASDEEASDTATFILDVLRVPRPHLSVSVVQNNAFTNYLQVIVTDTVSKTTSISLEIQNEDMNVDTIAPYTWSSDFNFGFSGTYSIDVHAIADVGDTLISEAFSLAAASNSSRWSGRSYDGRFSVAGDPGAVTYDQSFLIVDSSLFAKEFNDQASYVLGDENFKFSKAVEVRLGSQRDDLAIYRRKNSVTWEELPSLSKNGEIFTLSEKTGYFKLGPKTIIVPEQTNIHQNYPNPFNPTTNIIYDIGLMDGLSQNVSIKIYNLLGQHIRTLVENKDQIGQFKIQWNGQDKFGQPMGTGVYFVQLSTRTGIVKNKKIMLLK
ncbi:MAG: hypothetical protein CMG57_03505 [Candidatus Marinimicrobia bacterium]|nr:hypothetical protein [Candidatus Neomarinimicrobiota bacterium]